MDYKHLETFQIAANKLNFTKTAEALNFAQSSVTAHIKALETELDVQLFDRLGRTLALTDAGRKLLFYANQILSLTEEAKKAIIAEKENAGTLVIGAAESLCTYRLPPILTTFKQRFPKVQFQFSPGTSDREILQQLEKGNLDAAILMNIEQVPDAFITEKLRREEINVVASPNHPLFHREFVSAADLSSESLLLTEKNCSYRRSFDNEFAAHGFHQQQVFEFASVEAMKQCVISGLGVAVLPKMTIQKELTEGTIQILPWKGNPLYIHSYLVWHKNKWMSPILSAFLDLTRKALGGEKLQEQK
ncbi:LysR family transcriptional regulator [Heyndrickxia ginsengihumi]|uniref:LysR family transcriptional regulator n=1 Tax=Heyndrickxia ginsengihumi TaxID=363870 RepID=A0A0A6XYY4_9BACI|nr:LysR family transcriptional regulator [Heyndrickxia ginsengihumi]KHD85307.1 hypothetical protein NG54_09795 [Heyndrickxia ginsengihumi]MCM3024989.1 LysR family transcriptional regulator [Heyndrickxia ginsengihumi]NEY21690.1 LysR family transcriptional regulator [Heyndrickxia ginsengihumi]